MHQLCKQIFQSLAKLWPKCLDCSLSNVNCSMQCNALFCTAV